MLGRFIASFVVDRIGYIKSLIITVSLAIISFAAGILPGKLFAYILPITGFFFALIFPTITALAAKIYPDYKHKVLSFLFFFAGLGGLFGPWTVGYTANWLGIGAGFPILILFIICMLIILFVLKFRMRRSGRPAGRPYGDQPV